MSTGNDDVVKGSQAEAIDEIIGSLEKNAQFRGAVLVENEGTIILSKGYGYANQSTKNTSSTVFQIGSLTKQFTAAAILKLCEMGKVDLNESINHYLTDKIKPGMFSFLDSWKNIKVQNLLSHTSGIPNYTDRDDYDKIAQNQTVDDIIAWARHQKLNFTPGTEYEYSNTGYTLLGVIIEKQSSLTYAEFLKQNIFIPAGMEATGVCDQKFRSCPNAALGYCFDDDGVTLVEDHSENIASTFSDGSIYSTVQDLAKWSKILDGGSSVLSQKTIAMMTTPKLGDYGCGLIIDKAMGQRRIYHNGSVAGFNTNFCKFPQDNNTIIILGNNAGFDAEFLAGYICRVLCGKIDEVPKCVSFPRNFDFSSYLGKYQSDEDEDTDYELYLDDHNQLFIADEPPHQCFLLSNKCLLNASEGTELEFNEDDECVYVYDGFDNKTDTLVASDDE